MSRKRFFFLSLGIAFNAIATGFVMKNDLGLGVMILIGTVLIVFMKK